MSEKKAITESSIARMAGNIASGMVANPQFNDAIDLRVIAANSVNLARLITAELERESPPTPQCPEGWHESESTAGVHRRCRKCGLEWEFDINAKAKQAMSTL